MLAECVVYQSIFGSNGAPFQQLGNLMLDGLSTNEATLNTDSGKLYGSFTSGSGLYTLMLFKDILKLEPVAEAQGTIGSTTRNVQPVSQLNASGITGTVNFVQYLADDIAINVVAFVSKDKDLPMNNLNALADYDPVNGFALFHQLAFQYLTREFMVSRFKSKIWNPTYVDANALNAAPGGYDFSKCMNLWVLREAAAHYAFSRLAEKQNIDPGSMWDIRTTDSKNLVKAYLNSVDLTFDEVGQRVETESRTLSTWRISRA
jgi:hypothetical protein